MLAAWMRAPSNGSELTKLCACWSSTPVFRSHPTGKSRRSVPMWAPNLIGRTARIHLRRQNQRNFIGRCAVKVAVPGVDRRHALDVLARLRERDQLDELV